MKIIKRYKFAIVFIVVLSMMYILNREVGKLAIEGTLNNIWELIKLVPPIFILLGLMDVWVPKEKMTRFLGDDSGLKGGVMAFLLGSFAAGPIYAAFPIGAMFMKKGASIKNVMIFIGAWATTKVPMMLIEISSLGLKFTIIRLFVEITGIIIIAGIIDKMLSLDEKKSIYKNCKKL